MKENDERINAIQTPHQEQLKQLALHESGHAMLYCHFRIPFISVNIKSNNEKRTEGAVTTKINFSPESVCQSLSWYDRIKIIPIGIQILYAGPIAATRDYLNSHGLGSEKITNISINYENLDKETETYKNSDSNKIHKLGKIFAKDYTTYCFPVSRENWTDEEIDNWLNGLVEETDSLVSQYWKEIEAIAATLIERKILTENEVKKIIRLEEIRMQSG